MYQLATEREAYHAERAAEAVASRQPRGTCWPASSRQQLVQIYKARVGPAHSQPAPALATLVEVQHLQPAPGPVEHPRPRRPAAHRDQLAALPHRRRIADDDGGCGLCQAQQGQAQRAELEREAVDGHVEPVRPSSLR